MELILNGAQQLMLIFVTVLLLSRFHVCLEKSDVKNKTSVIILKNYRKTSEQIEIDLVAMTC